MSISSFTKLSDSLLALANFLWKLNQSHMKKHSRELIFRILVPRVIVVVDAETQEVSEVFSFILLFSQMLAVPVQHVLSYLLQLLYYAVDLNAFFLSLGVQNHVV